VVVHLTVGDQRRRGVWLSLRLAAITLPGRRTGSGLAVLWAIDVEEARDAIYRNFKALIHQNSE
jgi:hypothetical protein